VNATYPILGTEQTEKVQSWIASGRGVRAWTDQLITMHPADDILTPADNETKPSWRHGAYRDLSAESLRFYRKNRVVRTWTSTNAGRNAAIRNLPEDETLYAPGGIYHETYRVEEIFLSTSEDVKVSDDFSRPLHVEYRWAIVEYTAHEDRPDFHCGECQPRTDGYRCMAPNMPSHVPYCDTCGKAIDTL
jgi:hypothetical protein